MNIGFQKFCNWSIVGFLILYLGAFAGLAGFIPPSAPMTSTADLALFYATNRIGILVGQILCVFAVTLLFFWPIAISSQMAKIERGAFPLLSIVQYVTAAILATLFMLCNLIWIAAAYRADIDPLTLRTLHDLGWLVFVMAYPEYIVQLICIAIVGLSDTRTTPWLPRWACWATLWVAVMGTGGGAAAFFKTGPFAWNGLIGFWLPVGFFLLWLLGIILPRTNAALKRDALEAAR